MNSAITTIFEAFEWFMRLVRLNLVFLLACVSGLVLFSFFPAITASFAVADKWIKGNTDLSVWKEFWKNFKESYIRSQVVGFLMGIAILIIVVDLNFFSQIDVLLMKVPVMILLGLLLIVITITGLYIFPILLKSEVKVKELFITAFFTSLSYIHWTVINLTGIAGLLYVSYRFPGTLFFLTGSCIILWIACMNQIVRNKINRRYEKLKSVAE
ncbi:YesL family protein [Virgibacillus kekensis]|uniref:YesL family protein n=1 Tax=Virgibacillus kekensis TaxID=202261 RepID=A0ABV9DH00_9BACI